MVKRKKKFTKPKSSANNKSKIPSSLPFKKNNEIINFFHKNLGNFKEWSKLAQYLLVSCAVSFGNPLFEKLPQIIRQSKEEVRDDIINHLRLEVLSEFDSEVADWIESNWMHINEYTHKLCKGFG